MFKNIFSYNNAREMRKQPTKAEEILWKQLKAKKFHKYKFRRQPVLIIAKNKYIPDFCCFNNKLIVEIDGSIHQEKDINNYDKYKTNLYKSLGFAVLRFSNKQINSNLKSCLIKIYSTIVSTSAF